MGRCVESVSMFVIVLVNVIFFLGSALMLGLGVTAKVNANEVGKVVGYVLPVAVRDDLTLVGIDMSNIVVTNGTFLIVIGSIGVFVAGIGFCGACCRARCLLTLYATLMIILLLGQGALIAFAIVYPDTFRSFIQTSMISTLQVSFRDEFKLDANKVFVMPTGVVEIGWSGVQMKERCCGARNWTDYSTFTWNNTGIVPRALYAGPAVVPISCCKQKEGQYTFPPTYTSFIDLPKCIQGNLMYINQQNCYDAVEKDIEGYIRNYRGLAIGITVAVAATELIIIIMALLLLRKPAKYVRFVDKE